MLKTPTIKSAPIHIERGFPLRKVSCARVRRLDRFVELFKRKQ